MKRILAICVLLMVLSGCTGAQDAIEPMLQLRTLLLNGSCSFTMNITADYGDKSYAFTMACSADEKGNLSFEVQEPQTIAGITGKIEQGKGSLTFDDTALAFELLADGQLSPVSAPWVLISTLRGGYILSCGKDGQYQQVTLHDSYKDGAMQVEVWLNEENIPVQAEVLFEDRRILTMEVKSFVIS